MQTALKEPIITTDDTATSEAIRDDRRYDLINELQLRVEEVESLCVALGNLSMELGITNEQPQLMQYVNLTLLTEKMATEMRSMAQALYRDIYRNGASSAREHALQVEAKAPEKEPAKVTTPTESKKTESDWQTRYTGEKK